MNGQGESEITVEALFRTTKSELAKVLDSQGEADAAARIIFQDIAGYDREYIFANGDRAVLPFVHEKIDKAVGRVLSGEPVQYVTSLAQFCGMMLRVTPAVLIPRFETEGLVDIVTDRFSDAKDLNVLDICTGSGCIAIALARSLPFSSVTATDISTAALAVAAENARKFAPQVKFLYLDALDSEKYPGTPYDIIVSNPPYIAQSEKVGMDARVYDYEPASALFVPDSDPLEFYKAICRSAKLSLAPGGMLFFEINSLFAADIEALLKTEGFKAVELRRDYRGNYRYAIAQL